jgi:NAD(P)-dependent dehydrogenase (short-subunit alcohol dehydrogenase family)
MDASSKIALVTGAAKRLGRAIALRLAQEGWDIGVHYGQSVVEAQETVLAIQRIGRRAIALKADFAQQTQIDGLIQHCTATLGLPDCVVNSASLFAFDNAEQFSPEQFATHMQINAVAPIALSRDLYNARINAKKIEGRVFDHPSVIINLLDQKLANPNPDFLSYTLSKSALYQATTLLAQAYAPELRVVGLAPGLTLISGDQTQEGFERAHQQTPLGKSSTPDDIAHAVAYLASAHAVTGTTLFVDGGQHLNPSKRDVMFLTEC